MRRLLKKRTDLFQLDFCGYFLGVKKVGEKKSGYKKPVRYSIETAVRFFYGEQFCSGELYYFK